MVIVSEWCMFCAAESVRFLNTLRVSSVDVGDGFMAVGEVVVWVCGDLLAFAMHCV